MMDLNDIKMTVLVIEDDKALQAAIAEKLKINGLEVITARTKKEGIEVLEKENCDMIWLDHYLFGQEDGLDFLNEVRKHPEWKKIPIFVISNTASSDKVKTYLALGVDKYYTKAEYRLDEIINDIKEFLYNK